MFLESFQRNLTSTKQLTFSAQYNKLITYQQTDRYQQQHSSKTLLVSNNTLQWFAFSNFTFIYLGHAFSLLGNSFHKIGCWLRIWKQTGNNRSKFQFFRIHFLVYHWILLM